MVLIGEDEELGGYATHACGVECSEALVGVYAVVFLAVYAEDGRVPLVDEAVRRVLICALGVVCLVAVPVGILILPVREPSLLCVGVHRLKVEGTVVGDERLEALVVMAGEIVDREASEACAHTSQLVLVNERQVVGGIVDGCEIVVHALSGPVAADLLVPL